MPMGLVWAIVILVAIGLDVWLMRWLRGRLHPDETAPQVRLLNHYSPALTWLMHRLLPRLTERAATVAHRPETPIMAQAGDTSGAGRMVNADQPGEAIRQSDIGDETLARAAVPGRFDFGRPANLGVTVLAGLGGQVRRQPWAFALAGCLLFIALYVLFFTPPRLQSSAPGELLPPPRYFYQLQWQRAWLRENYTMLGWIIGLAGGAVSLAALSRGLRARSRAALEFSLLCAAVCVAALGQWTLNLDPPRRVPGALLYGLALTGLGVWAWRARARLWEKLAPTAFRWKEVWLILGLTAVAAFTRLYAAPDFPYGVEGDEKNWTAEVIHLTVDGRFDVAGLEHFDGVPLSFYMQAPFQRLLGAGIGAARLTVIFYSLLGGLAFYWLMRQLAPVPLAALATFLLSVSIADISGSRMGNVESHVKLWPILALALLVWAGRRGRLEIYALSGVALTLGLLTYDTVLPLLPLAFLLAAIDLYRQRIALREGVKRMAVLAAPTLLALPLSFSYYYSRFSYYEIGQGGWRESFSSALQRAVPYVLETWFVRTVDDFIYSRSTGPMLNAALLPGLMLGLVIAGFALGRPYARVMFFWAAFFFIPAPVLTYVPAARVYYPGLPAAYGLVALGLFAFVSEAYRLLDGDWRKVWLGALGLGLAWLGVFNVYIYFNEVRDPDDRRMRREMGELVAQGAAPDAHWFLPYVPGASEALLGDYRADTHTHAIELFMYHRVPGDQIPQAYELVPYSELLPRLLVRPAPWTRAEILLDKTAQEELEVRQAVIQTLLRCFPNGQLWSGAFFDRYSLAASALAQPACWPVTVRLSEAEAAMASGVSLLHWSLSSGTTSALRLACEPARRGVAWVEAEHASVLGGWRVHRLLTSGWLGEGFVLDEDASDALRLRVSLPADEPAYTWVRYYKRRVDQSPGQLHLGGQSAPFADVAEAQLNQWRWERVGPFDAVSGDAEWAITRRPAAEDPVRWALFIDALVFTTDPDFSPETDSAWEAMPAIVLALDVPATGGTVPFTPAGPGRHRCRVAVETGQPFVDAFGRAPAWSNAVEIQAP